MRCSVCHRRLGPLAACPVHPAVLAPGDETTAEETLAVDGYELLSLLGAGGFARVVAARRVDDGRVVALKVGHRHHDPRFAREAEALRALAGTQAAPAFLGEGVTGDGRPYLVMERLEGQSLAAWQAGLPGTGAAARDDLVRLFWGLCGAVDTVHAAGLVHRDLKPENVFLKGKDVVLLDFGLALSSGASVALDAQLTRTGQRLGTVLYMAPEQILDAREVGPPADVYSLGVVLFELLTARPPFVGDAAQVAQAHVARRPPRPSEFAVLPGAVDDLLYACLAKEPEGRPATAREVYASLRAALAQSIAEARAPSARAASRRKTVALCGLTADIVGLEGVLRKEGGLIARFSGERRLLAFPEQTSPKASVEAAVRVARRLSPRVHGPIVVHAAELRVREGPPVALAGAALERPAWCMGEVSPGVWLTPEAAGLLGQEAGELVRIDDEPSTTDTALPVVEAHTLHGRAELLSTLCAEAQAAHADRRATLTTVVGDVGLGKTRLAQELVENLATGPVIHACAPPPEAGEPDRLLATLLRAALQLGDGQVDVDTVEKTCGASYAAVALVLGILPDTDPRAVRVLAAPGALRHAVAKALGDALTRMAEAQPLAVCIDDAQWADPTTLDALEVATLAEASVPLFVCVVARPTFTALRPAWGERARRSTMHELSPLDAQATRALLMDLLRPVEYVPEAVLLRLENMAGGVPLYLVEIAHFLRSNGGIRRHKGGQAWCLEPDELLRASATPLGERLAERSLSRLPATLRDLARLCAVMGEAVTAREIEAIERNISREVSLDAGVGLSRLVRGGVLCPSDLDRFGFRHPLLREAILAGIPAGEERRIHRAVLEHLHSSASQPTLARVARHAAGCGQRDESAKAYLDLADEARERHRYVDAEELYGKALDQLDGDNAAGMARARGGRGRVRYRLQRFHEALEDLRAARAKAQSMGDDRAVLDLFLEEATTLDWLQDIAASAAVVEQARPFVARVADPCLDARFLMATGRTQYRNGLIAECSATLSDAVDQARRLGDHECYTISLLLLALAECASGGLDSSEAHCKEIILGCESVGDKLHLCAAYTVRVLLWEKRQLYDRAVQDQRTAVRIARELGHAQLEKMVTFNLSELLYWMGSYDEAWSLALRVRDLQQRFVAERPHPDDTLLLARIALAQGNHAEARMHMAWARDNCPPDMYSPWTRTLHRMVELVLDDNRADDAQAEAWEAIVAEARRTSVLHELLEVLYTRVEKAIRGRQSEEARRSLDEAMREAVHLPLWQQRLGELSRKIS